MVQTKPIDMFDKPEYKQYELVELALEEFKRKYPFGEISFKDFKFEFFNITDSLNRNEKFLEKEKQMRGIDPGGAAGEAAGGAAGGEAGGTAGKTRSTKLGKVESQTQSEIFEKIETLDQTAIQNKLSDPKEPNHIITKSDTGQLILNFIDRTGKIKTEPIGFNKKTQKFSFSETKLKKLGEMNEHEIGELNSIHF